MSTAAQIGIGIASSYVSGKKARGAANEASRREYALLKERYERIKAAYGPEAAEKAVQEMIEEISRGEAQAQVGAERDLYSRGMGERTPGAAAGITESAMKQKLEARGNIERDYPKYLESALAGLQGGYSAMTDRATQAASDATALPIDMLGMYMNAKGMKTGGAAKTPTTIDKTGPGKIDTGGGRGTFYTGWNEMQNRYNRPKYRKQF